MLPVPHATRASDSCKHKHGLRRTDVAIVLELFLETNYVTHLHVSIECKPLHTWPLSMANSLPSLTLVNREGRQGMETLRVQMLHDCRSAPTWAKRPEIAVRHSIVHREICGSIQIRLAHLQAIVSMLKAIKISCCCHVCVNLSSASE